MSAFDDILNSDEEQTETTEPTVETTEPVVDAVVAESPAPEQTEISEQAPVAEEAQPITREDGAVWSPNAKRWYRDGKIVAGEAPAETPSEPSIPSVPAAPPVAEAPKVEAPAGEPFVVRGGGQRHQIPGATVDALGRVTIAPEAVPQIKALFAAGIQHNANYGREKQEWTQKIAMAEQRGESRAKMYNEVATSLFDKVMDDNWLQSLIDNPHREREFLRRELALSLERAKMSIPQQAAAPEPQPEQIEQAFGQTLSRELDELLEDAPRGILTAEDIADMKAAFGRRMSAYAAEVDGEIMLDTHALKADFDREVKLAQRAAQQAIDAQKAAEKARAAAAFNAATAPKSPAPTPRKPTPTLVPATKPSGKTPDWDQSFKSAWTSDADED